MARRARGGIAAAVIVALSVALAPAASGDAGHRTSGARITERWATRVVDRNATFTAGASVGPKPTNPFDPAAGTVRVQLRSPAGTEVVVDAYWFQDYRRSLVGDHRGGPRHRRVARAHRAGRERGPRLPPREPA